MLGTLDWSDLALLLAQSAGGDDHWQQLGVGGALACTLIWIVLQFVLKFASIRREGKPASIPVNGTKSGERPVEYWAQIIGDLVEKCVERDVLPRLIENATELRAIREILNDMKVRRRS